MNTENILASPCKLVTLREAHGDRCLPRPLDAADDVWRGMQIAAAEIAAREPLLAPRLRHSIIRRNSAAEMLAAVLARRLGGADMPEAKVRALMLEVLSKDKRALADASADLDAFMNRDPACPHQLHVLLNLKGFHALQTHRVTHHLWLQGRHELASMLSNLGSLAFGIDIHPAARIAGGVMLDHGLGIVIGETAVIEENVSILQNVTLGGTGKDRGDRHPKIRSGVMIGAGATILGNIEVGTMSKVAAGSVVLKDVPPYSTVAGVPARVVRQNGENNFPAFEMRQTI